MKKELLKVDSEILTKALEVYGFLPIKQIGSHVTFQDKYRHKVTGVVDRDVVNYIAVTLTADQVEKAGACTKREFIRLVKGLAGKLPPGTSDDL